jgi:site-specific recombinase XerD
MLEHYFPREEKRAPLEHNYLASFIEEAACRYKEQDYYRRYAKYGLLSMSYFGNWLQKNSLPLCQVKMEHAQDFLKQFIPPMFKNQPDKASTRRKSHARAAVGFAVVLIRERHADAIIETPVQTEVGRYVEHLRRDRGLGEGTISNHKRSLDEFLSFYFAEREVDISEITPISVYEYIDRLPRTKSNSKRGDACTALRGYFRFLQLHGTPTSHLLAAVPVVRTRRAALSPNVMTTSDLNSLMDSIDSSKATGKRDYAAILCMCDLGMRVGDVARLSLDDINWRKGSIRVANHKKKEPYWLPLPERVGKALVDYLANGRPSSRYREIFLRHARPVGTPATVHSIKTAMCRIWDDSGMHARFSGTHILRHSAATCMKRNGVDLKSIADVLGHGSLQTTTLYVQMDLPALRGVAQGWPGGGL